ncbi:MAG: hypothetical protein LBI99_03230 [Propionibacteriaceae bacterium]|jgi:hypothetical protein|nr:hypothetical protein [Propionibacteriaceae bacterium]
MRHSWILSVARLIIVSRPFRGLAVSVFVACVLVTLASFAVVSMSLSPGQRAEERLGAATAKIQDDDMPSVEPYGELGGPTDWLRSIMAPSEQVLMALEAHPPLRLGNGEVSYVSYAELPMPSAATTGKFVLLDGSWPSRTGECLASPSVTLPVAPTAGEWELTIVGTAQLKYYPLFPSLLCAPGTWQTWQVPVSARADFGEYAGVSFYLVGGAELDSALEEFAPPRELSMWHSMDVRAKILSDTSRVGANSLLMVWAPLLLIPLMVGAVAGGLLARWAARVNQLLWQVGVGRRAVRLLFVFSVLLSSLAAGSLGAAAGLVAGWALSPLLQMLNEDMPLSDLAADLLPGSLAVLAIVIASVLVTAVGCSLKGRRRSRSESGGLLSRAGRWLAGLLLVASVITAALAGVSMWWIIVGSLLMVAAGAALAPTALNFVAARLSRKNPGSSALAGRILCDERRHWQTTVAGLAAVLGTIATLFVIPAATVASLLPYFSAYVPAGVVMLEVSQQDMEDLRPETIAAFESDIGVSQPMRVTTALVVPERGQVYSFETVDDLEVAVGPLSPAQRDFLTAGGILSPQIHGTAELRLALPDDSVIDGQVMNLTFATDRRYQIEWFSLVSAIPEQYRQEGSVAQYLLYTGLSPKQDEQAREWPNATGRSAVFLLAHRADAEFRLPLGVGLSLAGFGLLFCPVVWMLLRREATSLRPVLASAMTAGAPARFGSGTLLALAATAVGISALIALVQSVGYLIVLVIVYQGEVFDPWGIPWWVLGLYFVGLAAGALSGSALASRRLHHQEIKATL